MIVHPRNIAIYQAVQNVLDNTPSRLPSCDGQMGVHDETLKTPFLPARPHNIKSQILVSSFGVFDEGSSSREEKCLQVMKTITERERIGFNMPPKVIDESWKISKPSAICLGIRTIPMKQQYVMFNRLKTNSLSANTTTIGKMKTNKV